MQTHHRDNEILSDPGLTPARLMGGIFSGYGHALAGCDDIINPSTSIWVELLDSK